jgi:glutathione S-transferase
VGQARRRVRALAAREALTLRPVRRYWRNRTRAVLELRPTTLRDDEARVRAAFDAIAERLADGRPHLCGERFTAADLTFACLATPVLAPPEYGITLPQPNEMPEPLATKVRSFRDHPAGAYAMELYRTSRRRALKTGGSPQVHGHEPV